MCLDADRTRLFNERTAAAASLPWLRPLHGAPTCAETCGQETEGAEPLCKGRPGGQRGGRGRRRGGPQRSGQAAPRRWAGGRVGRARGGGRAQRAASGRPLDGFLRETCPNKANKAPYDPPGAGAGVVVLEAGDGVGGRVRTDAVDGFLLDRGFQIFLTSYPEAQEALDYPALDLRPFYAGALVRWAGGFHRVADPLRCGRVGVWACGRVAEAGEGSAADSASVGGGPTLGGQREGPSAPRHGQAGAPRRIHAPLVVGVTRGPPGALRPASAGTLWTAWPRCPTRLGRRWTRSGWGCSG